MYKFKIRFVRNKKIKFSKIGETTQFVIYPKSRVLNFSFLIILKEMATPEINFRESYNSITDVYTVQFKDMVITYDYNFMKAALNTKSKEYKLAQRFYSFLRNRLYNTYDDYERDCMLDMVQRYDPETFYARVCKMDEEHNRRKQYAKEFQLQKEHEAHMFESSFNNGLVDY